MSTDFRKKLEEALREAIMASSNPTSLDMILYEKDIQIFVSSILTQARNNLIRKDQFEHLIMDIGFNVRKVFTPEVSRDLQASLIVAYGIAYGGEAIMDINEKILKRMDEMESKHEENLQWN